MKPDLVTRVNMGNVQPDVFRNLDATSWNSPKHKPEESRNDGHYAAIVFGLLLLGVAWMGIEIVKYIGSQMSSAGGASSGSNFYSSFSESANSSASQVDYNSLGNLIQYIPV